MNESVFPQLVVVHSTLPRGTTHPDWILRARAVR